MSAILKMIIEVQDGFEEKRDLRIAHYPLMSSPWPMISMTVGYLYFIYSLGPRLMKNRKPIDLKYTMMIFNVVQILLNLYMFVEGMRQIYIPRVHTLVCDEVDFSTKPLALLIVEHAYLYFVVKLLDLLDTVFMVLRKKDSQISFLHVYHHSAMFFGVWWLIYFTPGGHYIFIGIINCFVHVVMYTYYLITALYPQYKANIWWKRHITQIQLIQFVMIIVHSAVALLTPNCNLPKPFLLMFMIQDCFMFMMFWDFYKKAYLSSDKRRNGKQVDKDK